MKSGKIILYYQTIKHLKLSQLFYQLWYRINLFPITKISRNKSLTQQVTTTNLTLIPWIEKNKVLDNSSICFLNLNYTFDSLETIDWNYGAFGKLWTYNLNYMDFLLQPDMDKETGMQFISGFIDHLTPQSVGLEPYPVSLRGINWIKFLISHNIQDTKISCSLLNQYQVLYQKPEYHLLGNHLLENGFSLLFGAFYFNNLKFYKKAFRILISELKEQVLPDGGHFERSPMYHQIVLDRILDCINLLQNSLSMPDQQKLLDLLKEKAQCMLQWLDNMTFTNGDIPMLNDAAPGIAPETKELKTYALRLGFLTKKDNQKAADSMKESGYRRFGFGPYECIVDVGPIGSDYQPGHAHADTFNFVLNHRERPVIVDTGISTYEKNARRQFERSTAAHNTVVINNIDSSAVWGGFRVACRAGITSLQEYETGLIASHNGYRHIGLLHQRQFEFSSNMLTITDKVNGKNAPDCIAFLHFHPHVNPRLINNAILLDGINIRFEGYSHVSSVDYLFAAQFNSLLIAKAFAIKFKSSLKSVIRFN